MARRKLEPTKPLIAESPIIDQSELASLYPEVKSINPNPISTPAEIAERRQKAQEKQIKTLRKSAMRIGLYVALPYVLGLFAIQKVVMTIPSLSPGNVGGAMFVVFLSFLLTTSSVFIGYFLFRSATDLFNSHLLRSWPVITTIVISIIGSTPLALDAGLLITNEWLGYLLSLVLITIASIVVTTSLIYLWTTQLHPRVKLSILLVYVAVFTVLLFL